MNEMTRRALLAAARAAVEAALAHKAPPEIPAVDGIPAAPRGAFVSVRVDGDLRGCIGIVHPSAPLVETVMSCAVSAATGDLRFTPLRSGDMPRARFEISVLSPPEPVVSHEDIEVGVHGLIIGLGRRTGLLLPQVATEHSMTRDQFLDAVCHKAGLAEGSWAMEGVRLQRFTAEVFGEDPAAP